MKKTLSIITVGLLLAACEPAELPKTAQSLQVGYPICESKLTFDEFVKADVNNDRRIINHLESTGKCVMIINNAVPFSIVEQDWGTVKVRIWQDDENYLDAWTYVEATQEPRK